MSFFVVMEIANFIEKLLGIRQISFANQNVSTAISLFKLNLSDFFSPCCQEAAAVIFLALACESTYTTSYTHAAVGAIDQKSARVFKVSAASEINLW